MISVSKGAWSRGLYMIPSAPMNLGTLFYPQVISRGAFWSSSCESYKVNKVCNSYCSA